MKRIVAFALIVMVLGVLPGCASTGDATTSPEVAGDKARGKSVAGGSAETGRYGGRNALGRGGSGDPSDTSGPMSQRVIYFAYDSFDVLPEYVSVVSAHAGYLASHTGRTVTLEGHADERGSSEYNVALGEQRARAVAKLMVLQGVADEQIQIVSYGEEKPASAGHDDAAWQQNRRVEIHYSGE